MKVLLNATLAELEDKINRQILVDENIELKDLCEFIIVSMNGNKIPIYIMQYGTTTYYPYEIEESKNDKTLIGLKLSDLKINKMKSFCIDYNFDNFYYFNVEIVDFIDDDNKVYCEVLSGKGSGIIDDKMINYLVGLTFSRKNYESYYSKSEKEFLQKDFNLDEVNNKISDYMKNREKMLKPKQYLFNVSLEGFNKEIKRKILVNNDITIYDFCKKIIVSMNSDLSHEFGIKVGKEYLENYYSELELFYLNLKEKQRLKIIYDWGDNWNFNITLSKITEGHSKNNFEVLSGKGYGIIDDCGGVWELEKIFNGSSTSWGKYNIENFDLDKCNNDIKNI